MTHNRHFFILVVSAIVLLGMGVSCKDKKPSGSSCTDPNFCQSVLAAKDFFFFKEGSWWVYEEATSHERDSMYVIQSVNSTTNYNFDITIESALTDYEYHYWPEYYGGIDGCSPTGPIYKKCLYVRRSKGKLGDYIGEESAFFVSYHVRDSASSFNVNYANNYIYCEEILPDYNFNGSSLGNTVRIYEPHSLQEHNQSTNHFFSKNIGLVRKELLDSNQVWNLVNYHIEP